jgi:prepilin-type N-terminal cleavage/methylation domain-containing protein/prepilin-type processing-associated H-X9-DG protein
MNLRKSSQSRPSAGFTLIELLVVIAIIAILAAILFPVFAKVREKARQTSCASNMKQLALAVIQYKQDFDELAPCGTDFNYNAGTFTVGNGGVPGLGWGGQIYAYAKSPGVYVCPDDYVTAQATTATTVFSVVSYAYNYNIDNDASTAGGGTNATCCSSITPQDIGGATLAGPAQSVMFSEIKGVNVPNLYANEIVVVAGVPQNDAASPIGNGDPDGGGTNPIATGPLGDYGLGSDNLDPNFPTGRHSGGANYACWDGHVKWLRGSSVCQGFNAFESSGGETPVTIWSQNLNNQAAGTQGTFTAGENGIVPAVTFSTL